MSFKKKIWAMVYKFWSKVVQRKAAFKVLFYLFSVFPTGSSSLRRSTLRTSFGAFIFSYALCMLLTQRLDFTLEHQQPNGSISCVCCAGFLLITVSVLPFYA